MASVMFRRITDVPSIDAVGRPRFPCRWCVIDNDFCAGGSKGGGIVVESAVQNGFRGKLWIDGQRSEEIESGCRLGDEAAS